jgi:hypothetical protein
MKSNHSENGAKEEMSKTSSHNVKRATPETNVTDYLKYDYLKDKDAYISRDDLYSLI